MKPASTRSSRAAVATTVLLACTYLRACEGQILKDLRATFAAALYDAGEALASQDRQSMQDIGLDQLAQTAQAHLNSAAFGVNAGRHFSVAVWVSGSVSSTKRRQYADIDNEHAVMQPEGGYGTSPPPDYAAWRADAYTVFGTIADYRIGAMAFWVPAWYLWEVTLRNNKAADIWRFWETTIGSCIGAGYHEMVQMAACLALSREGGLLPRVALLVYDGPNCHEFSSPDGSIFKLSIPIPSGKSMVLYFLPIYHDHLTGSG